MELDNLEFLSGASNIHGHFTIANSVFANYTHGCGFCYQHSDDKFSSAHEYYNITLSNLIFQHANFARYIDITVFSSIPLKVNIIDVTVANNTKADHNYGISFRSFSSVTNHVILQRYNQIGNIVSGGTATSFSGSNVYFLCDGKDIENLTSIKILDCNFINSAYIADTSDPYTNLYSVVYFYNVGIKPLLISVVNTTIYGE